MFFRTAVLRKLFDIRFLYKHCNFSRVCLLVKMASKTVTRSIRHITTTQKWEIKGFHPLSDLFAFFRQTTPFANFQWSNSGDFSFVTIKTAYFKQLIFTSFLPYTYSAKISDSSSETSASDSCKLCHSASFGWTHTSLLWCLPFGFPWIRLLFNFILFWILGIRYVLCTEHLNTDRGEAACFQKLRTTIKRQ